jgi:hypothetical protein
MVGLLLVLALVWLGWFTLSTIGMAIAVLIGVVLILRVRRLRILAIVVLFLANPLGVVVLHTIHQYFTNTAVLQGAGYPSVVACNLDRELRVPHLGGGCVVSDNLLTKLAIHNGVLRRLVRTLGPRKDAYLGPYPTEEEAAAVIAAGAVTIKADEVCRDRISLADGSTVQLVAGTGMKMFMCIDWPIIPKVPGESGVLVAQGANDNAWEWLSLEDMPNVRAAVFAQHCVVLDIPLPVWSSWNHTESASSGIHILIDRDTGEAFAMYGYGELTSMIRPPMFFQWTRIYDRPNVDR